MLVDFEIEMLGLFCIRSRFPLARSGGERAREKEKEIEVVRVSPLDRLVDFVPPKAAREFQEVETQSGKPSIVTDRSQSFAGCS